MFCCLSWSVFSFFPPRFFVLPILNLGKMRKIESFDFYRFRIRKKRSESHVEDIFAFILNFKRVIFISKNDDSYSVIGDKDMLVTFWGCLYRGPRGQSVTNIFCLQQLPLRFNRWWLVTLQHPFPDREYCSANVVAPIFSQILTVPFRSGSWWFDRRNNFDSNRISNILCVEMV